MPEVGIVIPAHASALGKAMLAFHPDEAERLLTGDELRSMTGETLTSPIDLRSALEDVRTSGIAREQDEAVLGEGAVASPVFDSWGDVVGAIGVVFSGPVESDPADQVRQTARALSRELGAQSWPPPTAQP
jgi:DNA-binding IclR family transcriptional regulator